MEPVEINSRNNDSFKGQTSKKRIENIEQQLKTILINLNGDIKPRLENLENFCNPSYLGNRSIEQLEIQEVILDFLFILVFVLFIFSIILRKRKRQNF